MTWSLKTMPKADFEVLIKRELELARLHHAKPFASKHEGLAIIQEEFEEFKTEVFHGIVKGHCTSELVQLAAMCQRFYEDVI